MLRLLLSISVLPELDRTVSVRGFLMEAYQLANLSDYEHFMIYDHSYIDTCPDGCEVDDEDVVMATYVLELVLMPLVGAVGVLGNLLSIIVLYKSDQKTTFQHVDNILNPT